MDHPFIACPWCKEPQHSITEIGPLLLTSGASRCFKCHNWFEWQENKVISYTTYKIVQMDNEDG